MDELGSEQAPYQSKAAVFFSQLGTGLTRLPVIFIALGLLAIAIGYNGASGYTALAAQFPYLLSGGILGLGLIIVGSSMLVSQSAREDSARVEALLQALVASPAIASAMDEAPADVSDLVVAGTSSYHLPSCRLVDGRGGSDYLTAEEARARSLSACRVCKPQTAKV